MNTLTMIVTMGSAMALSLLLALALERLLWRDLLRGMVACMEIAARGESGHDLRHLDTARRTDWQEIRRILPRH